MKMNKRVLALVAVSLITVGCASKKIVVQEESRVETVKSVEHSFKLWDNHTILNTEGGFLVIEGVISVPKNITLVKRKYYEKYLRDQKKWFKTETFIETSNTRYPCVEGRD